MTLMLHAGANAIDYDGLRQLDTPDATATHVPIPHYRVVDLAAHSLSYYGHEVVEQHFGVTPDGARFFGVLMLRSPYGDYTDMVGLRNSHDKKFPIGISFGSRVFVCDNLAFSADHVIKRKHTANAKRDLPGLVGEIIEPLALRREEQSRKITLYKGTAITDDEADLAVMKMYRQGILNVTRIADVLNVWDSQDEVFLRDWGKCAWRLFNVVTGVITDKVVAESDLTPRLHKVIDGVCERLH